MSTETSKPDDPIVFRIFLPISYMKIIIYNNIFIYMPNNIVIQFHLIRTFLRVDCAESGVLVNKQL